MPNFMWTVGLKPETLPSMIRTGYLGRSWTASALVAVFGVTLACCAAPLHADEAYVETAGGSVTIMRANANIRMVAEKVRAKVSTDLIEVDCTFWMKNEGPADTVLCGFPDGAVCEDSDQNEFLTFRSWVDGVEVKSTRLLDAQAAAGDSEACPDSWWVKSVFFPRGAVRTLRDHYTVGPSSYPRFGLAAFRYVLSTGASWKGNIGAAELTATLVDIPPEWVTGTRPQARRNGRVYRWTFRNFEPGSADGSPEVVSLGWREPGRSLEPDEAQPDWP